MEALVYFALWAAAIFLMMRFGCGAHVLGHGRARHSGPAEQSDAATEAELRWVPPEKDIDPVCGKRIPTRNAKPSVYDGNVHYFCSRECREAFEAAPDIYVDGPTAKPSITERSHV